MKIKKIIINLVAIVMVITSCLCFTACEDIVKLEVQFEAYNYDTESNFEDENMTLTVELYRHLAKETVDSIKKNVENKAYDNMMVYKFTDYNKSQFMMGDLKYGENGKIEQVIRPEIKGEFASNGVTGSDLKVEKGSIGVWRSYYACDDGLTTSSNARDTGRGTWFIPTTTDSTLQGDVCIFGKVDITDSKVIDIYDAFASFFNDTVRYDNYEVYFTGEYDESKADQNYGLEFNCVLEEDFNEEEIENLFTPDSDEQQLNWFKHYTISVPVLLANGNQTLRVKSIKII